jgi:hypothetical protein
MRSRWKHTYGLAEGDGVNGFDLAGILCVLNETIFILDALHYCGG